MVAKAVGPECTLLEAAARNGFGNIPLSGLKKIASLLGVSATSTTTFDMLHALLQHVLPDLSEDDILGFMSRRCKSTDQADDLLTNTEVVEDCMDPADAEEAEKLTKGA